MVGNQLAELLAKVPFTARRVRPRSCIIQPGYQRAEEKQWDRELLWEGRADRALSRYFACRELTNFFHPPYFFSLHHPLLPFVFPVVAFLFLFPSRSPRDPSDAPFLPSPDPAARPSLLALSVIIEKSYSRLMTGGWLHGGRPLARASLRITHTTANWKRTLNRYRRTSSPPTDRR